MSSSSPETPANDKKLLLFLGYGYVARHLVTELYKHNYAHIILPTRNKSFSKEGYISKNF